MIHDRVGADEQNHVGEHDIHDRIGYRAGADAFEQRGNAGCVAEPRAMVHVVRAKTGSHELLE